MRYMNDMTNMDIVAPQSVQLNALNGADPSAVDHVVLTGFSANTFVLLCQSPSTHS